MLLPKANISTIDAFCKELIIQHFEALDIPPDFTILTENTLALLKREAMDETLEEMITRYPADFANLSLCLGESRQNALPQAIGLVYEYLRSLPFPTLWLERVKGYYRDFSHIACSPWGEFLINRGLTRVNRGILTLEKGLKELEGERYEITEKGRHDGALTEDSIAFTVKQRAENAVAAFNRQLRRSSFVKTRLVPRSDGTHSVILSLDDDTGSIMTLELAAPDQRQAVRLGKLFEKKAEEVYSVIMMTLLDEEDNLED